MLGAAKRLGLPVDRRAGRRRRRSIVLLVPAPRARRPTPSLEIPPQVGAAHPLRARPDVARRDAGGGRARWSGSRGVDGDVDGAHPPPAFPARRRRAARAGARRAVEPAAGRRPPRATAGRRADHRPHRRHADRAAAEVRARHARRRAVGQVRVPEPGRLGQGSRRLPDDPRRHPHRRAQARPDDHRLDQRQHRRRLLAHRRRARLPGHAGDAGERLLGAAQDHRGVRHDAGLLRSDGGLRRRHSPVPQDGRGRTRGTTSIPTSTRTCRTRSATTTPPGARSGSRPRGASPTS